MKVTRSPRASSRAPIEDAARPLPKLETTPPVTKIYFGIVHSFGEFKNKKVKVKSEAEVGQSFFLPFTFLLFPCLGARFRRIVGLFFIVINSAAQILLNFN